MKNFEIWSLNSFKDYRYYYLFSLLQYFVIGFILLLFPLFDLIEAQTNERIYERLDLRTVTPGARAVGMGKTFVGLADDATAAYSNPAGLSNLMEQEFSFESQVTNIKHERLISKENDETEIFGETVWIPSFLSYVFPKGRHTISLFYNRIQDYREKFQFRFREIPSLGTFEDGAFGDISVQIDNYGLGYAYVVNRYLSLGGSFVLSTVDVETEGRSGTPLNPRNGTNTNDNDIDFTGIIGLLVKPLKNLSLGAVYFHGSTFNLETTLFGNFLSNGRDITLTGERRSLDYVVPRRFAAGASWRIVDSFTVLADVVHVKYSDQITDKFLIVDFQDPSAQLTRDNFTIRDVWEIHVGAEYRYYMPDLTLAIRGGIFTDPDHSLRFSPANNDHPAQEILDFRFNTVDDKTDVGFTFGGGIAVKNKIQLDLAVSFSPDRDEFVISAVYKP